jgi:hypothetical protein
VTNCYDEFKSGEQAKQFDQLCGNFYEAAHIANSHEKYQYLMECINVVKEQLTDDSNWGAHHVTESTKKLLSPLKVRGKGRPPVNRKIPIEEKIIKKQRKKKKNVMICSGEAWIFRVGGRDLKFFFPNTMGGRNRIKLGGRNRKYRNFSTRKLYTPTSQKKFRGVGRPPRPYEAAPLMICVYIFCIFNFVILLCL